MKRWLSRLWRWSPVVTLPIAIIFLHWATTTYRQFESFRVEYDSRPVQMELHSIGVDQWNELVRHAEIASQTRSLANIPEAYALNTVQLFVSESEISKLQARLPYSGYEYVKGQLVYPDGLHQIKLRYRGDFAKHWAFGKKSIRVKTRKDELFEGMRQFNLIVPKWPGQINNYLSYRLALILDLISPRCELVNVTMNGRNLGMHEFTEQLEEGTLRRWDRMPGDLYSGELIGKSQIRGAKHRVFEQPGLWDKVAANNHYELTSYAPLDELLQLLAESPSEETQARLSKMLDMDAWGRFGAFELLTQTHHFDEFHNWRLFWDPWALKFEPVVWDPAGWAPEMRPRTARGDKTALDLVHSRLHIWLHRNGDFLAARNRALRDFYETGKAERFLAEVDWGLNAAREAVSVDPNIRPTMDRIEQGMEILRDFIEQCLRDVRLGHVEALGTVSYVKPDDDGVIAFEVTGRQPVEEVVLRFKHPVERVASALVRVDRADGPVSFDLSGGVRAEGNTLRVPVRMFEQMRPYFRTKPWRPQRQQLVRQLPGYYELFVDTLQTDNPLMDVQVRRGGRMSRAEEVANLQATPLDWLFRSNIAMPPREPVVWRSDLTISGITRITDDVIIEPGTTIRLEPDASLLFAGRVTALGTAEQPIRFVAADREAGPFGTVAINGPACSGSTFRYCHIQGGSGLKIPLEEYCSMFSIHNCVDVRIENCEFDDNSVFDDMIHAMYSEVIFDGVELRNALSDALDCDISDVIVRNSRFIASGNDHLDLMTAQAVVHDCAFLDAGDKGISIGEGSSMVAVRNLFDACNRGMEAKDGSIAYVVNCEIRNCKLAINAYRKNWRYDAGGNLTIQQSVFKDNEEMPTADPYSFILILDCLTDKPVLRAVPNTANQQINRVEMRRSRQAEQAGPDGVLPFPQELKHMEAMSRAVWASIGVIGGASGR